MLPLVRGCSKPREVGLWLGLPVARPCPGGAALVLRPLFVSSLIPGSHRVPKVSVLEGDSRFICCVLVGGTNANLHTRPVMCPGIRSQMDGDRRAPGMRPHAHHQPSGPLCALREGEATAGSSPLPSQPGDNQCCCSSGLTVVMTNTTK